MTDNTQLTTKPNKPEPKYRKKLNQEQIAVLQLLYRFRFASSEQIAKHQAKPNSKAIQKRLKILEDQELIAKRYDKSYKLKGKPAQTASPTNQLVSNASTKTRTYRKGLLSTA
jgi:predicted transcriptional regulator